MQRGDSIFRRLFRLLKTYSAKELHQIKEIINVLADDPEMNDIFKIVHKSKTIPELHKRFKDRYTQGLPYNKAYKLYDLIIRLGPLFHNATSMGYSSLARTYYVMFLLDRRLFTEAFYSSINLLYDSRRIGDPSVVLFLLDRIIFSYRFSSWLSSQQVERFYNHGIRAIEEIKSILSMNFIVHDISARFVYSKQPLFINSNTEQINTYVEIIEETKQYLEKRKDSMSPGLFYRLSVRLFDTSFFLLCHYKRAVKMMKLLHEASNKYSTLSNKWSLRAFYSRYSRLAMLIGNYEWLKDSISLLKRLIVRGPAQRPELSVYWLSALGFKYLFEAKYIESNKVFTKIQSIIKNNKSLMVHMHEFLMEALIVKAYIYVQMGKVNKAVSFINEFKASFPIWKQRLPWVLACFLLEARLSQMNKAKHLKKILYIIENIGLPNNLAIAISDWFEKPSTITSRELIHEIGIHVCQLPELCEVFHLANLPLWAMKVLDHNATERISRQFIGLKILSYEEMMNRPF